MRKIVNILVVLPIVMMSTATIHGQDAYESCCGAEPVEMLFKDKDGREHFVYVPNVFITGRKTNEDTQNENEFKNDVFRPYVGEGVVGVMYFEVYYEP